MIDEDIVVEERGRCVCIGCTGLLLRHARGRELLLVCTHCALSVEASFLDDELESAKTKRKKRRR